MTSRWNATRSIVFYVHCVLFPAALLRLLLYIISLMALVLYKQSKWNNNNKKQYCLEGSKVLLPTIYIESCLWYVIHHAKDPLGGEIVSTKRPTICCQRSPAVFCWLLFFRLFILYRLLSRTLHCLYCLMTMFIVVNVWIRKAQKTENNDNVCWVVLCNLFFFCSTQTLGRR